MNLVTQPPNSSICGHCCVAMITGKPIEEVISFIGHKRATRTKELVAALNYFGIDCASPLMKTGRLTKGNYRVGLPDLGILKITYDERKNTGHWVVKNVDDIYCPSLAVMPLETYKQHPEVLGRITSFLFIDWAKYGER